MGPKKEALDGRGTYQMPIVSKGVENSSDSFALFGPSFRFRNFTDHMKYVQLGFVTLENIFAQNRLI
jgi:hypothetical protein